MKTFEDFYKEHVINEGTNRINKVTELLDKANVQDEKVRSTLLKWARSSNNDDVLNKEARKLISEPWENGEEERKQLLTLMNSDKGKEGYHKNNTLAAAVEKAAKTKNFEVVDKKIEDIENKCTDEEKKAKLTPALNKLRDAIDKVREAASVVAEDPIPLPADEDSEFDKLVQAAIKRAEEADKVIRSINIVYNKESSGVAQVNAKEAAKNIFDDLLRILGRDTSTLLKATDFVKAAARSNGEAKILSSEELTKCYNDAAKDGFSGLDPKEVNTPLFKKSLLVCIGILLLKKHANSPDFTLQGMAQGSGYEKDQVLTEVSKRLSSINIDDKIKQEIGLADISKSDTFIPAVQKYINNIAKGTFSPKAEEDSNTKPEETKDPSPSPSPSPSPTNTPAQEGNPTPTQEEKPAEDTEEKPAEESNSLAKLNNSSSPEDVKNAVKEAFGTNNAGQVESKLLNAYYKRCDEVQKANSKMAAKSGESKVRTVAPEEPTVQEAEELVNLILEGRGNRLRLRQDAEATKAGWEDAKDELNKMAAGYLEQAEIIANGYTDTTPSKKRDSILLKLRSMYSSLALDLSKIFAKHKKSNSYGELGSILYNARMRKDANEQKKEAKYKNSEKGRRDAQIDEITTKKLPEAIEAFKKIDSEYETLAKVLSYGILHPNNLKDLAKAAWNNESKKTIGEICLKALSDNGEIEGLTIDTLQPLLSKLSQIKEILPTVQKRAAEYEEGTQYSNIEDDKNIYNKLSSKAIAFIGKMRSLGDKLTSKILLKDEISSLSFKDYYNTIYEDEQQQQAQQSQNNVDLPNLSRDEKRAVAFAILATSNDEQELKTAAEYLSLVGKDGTPSGYIKAIEKYKKENAQAIAQVKASIARQANAVLQQPQTPQVAPQVQQPVTQPQTPQVQQPVAQQQPAQQPQQPIQATVTTSACGNFTIPDRLNKKLIRRKIGNTFFA